MSTVKSIHAEKNDPPPHLATRIAHWYATRPSPEGDATPPAAGVEVLSGVCRCWGSPVGICRGVFHTRIYCCLFCQSETYTIEGVSWTVNGLISHLVNTEIETLAIRIIYTINWIYMAYIFILGRSLMIGWRKKSWNLERVPLVFTFVCVCVSVCELLTTVFELGM